MIQKYPKKLRPNVLLTRYPIVFIHGIKSIFHSYNYWHGIPDFLKNHGFETHILDTYWRGPQKKRVVDLEKKILSIPSNKVHIIAHSFGTLDSIVLADLESLKNNIASITLVSPPFDGSPWADKFAHLTPGLHQEVTQKGAQEIVLKFKNKSAIPITTIISEPAHNVTPLLFMHHRLLTRELRKRGLKDGNDGLVSVESQNVATRFSTKTVIFPGDHHQVVGAGPWPKGEKTAHEVYLDHCISLAETDLQNAK